ncbi:ABC transporter substrate-binding protein [Dinoroseobacter sp. S124A]|uniref:ABC transporter substrate-binding protein n=1 Tax=Dinoroseobacter sp. S124A TaxID=3415128 RepID=UPI003C7E8ECB
MDHSTRRKLLQTGLAAALLAAGGMPVAAGARHGGRLRIGLSGGPAPELWDPRFGPGLFQMVSGAGLVFDTLTEIAPDGLLRGALATGWTPSEAGRVWTLDLDPEARFHGGQPFEAADAIASLDLHKTPGDAGHGIRSLIAEMRLRGPHRFDVRLHRANADFPYLLSDPALIMGPRSGAAEVFRTGAGTGPYRVASFDGAARLLVARVPGHPRTAQGNWFDTVEILVLPRAEDRARAFAEGRVDVVDRLPTRLSERLERAHRAQTIAIPATDALRFSPGAGCAPARVRRVMEVLHAGIDRRALIAGDPGLSLAAMPGPQSTDPEATRQALGALTPEGLTLSIDGDLGEQGARLVARIGQQMSELGVPMRLATSGEVADLHVARLTTRPTHAWTLLSLFGGAAQPISASCGPAAAAQEYVPILSEANLVVADWIGRPEPQAQPWATGHTRMGQRWWRA